MMSLQGVSVAGPMFLPGESLSGDMCPGGSVSVGRPPESEKRPVRILLECIPVYSHKIIECQFFISLKLILKVAVISEVLPTRVLALCSACSACMCAWCSVFIVTRSSLSSASFFCLYSSSRT